MTGGDAVLAQMLVGNSYSTTPVRKLHLIIIYKLNQNVKVTAQEWFQSQMAFGQVNKQELKSNNLKATTKEMTYKIFFFIWGLSSTSQGKCARTAKSGVTSATATPFLTDGDL